MMNYEKQMSIKTDNKNEVFTSYLQMFKNAFKKISKPLLIIGLLLFLNVGNKFSVMSESTSTSFKVETKVENERYFEMLYKELSKRSFKQQIEFESEILIPDYIEFKYIEYAYQVSQELGVPTRTTFRLIHKESSFKDDVTSKQGAHGLMQLMPDTRKTYYVKLRLDTLNLDRNQEDILIGLTYVKDLQEYWKKRGNSEKTLLTLSLAAYNAGPGAVMKYKGVPPYKETTDFVTFIIKPHSNPVFYANIMKKNTNKDIS